MRPIHPKDAKAELDEHFGVELPELHRFNIAPSQPVPAICADAVKSLKWGFVPGWSKEPTVKFSNINARCETVATSSAYRGSFRHKRCLMVADGFYEWRQARPRCRTISGSKTAAHSPSRASGIRWHDELETCALITTTANKVVEVAHGRMPVILQREDYQAWLDPKATPDELMGLLKPLPQELMIGYPVGKVVNSPKYDGPECVVGV